jgi:hypothetical protein
MGLVNNELQRTWKDEIVPYFKILSWSFLGGAEEN